MFNAVSSTVPLAVIPQENSIFGPVTETGDLLRLPVVGKDIFITGETILSIQHCLVVRKGVKLEQIQTILSHEQASGFWFLCLQCLTDEFKALGQCRNFISTNIPAASTVKMPSTAAAAQALLSAPNPNRDPFKCAAICSRIVVTIFNGLDVLREGIQDTEGKLNTVHCATTEHML